MSLFLSLLIPLLLGFLLVSLFWPDQRLDAFHLLFKACLGAGLGLGLSSCGFFLWLLTFDPSQNSFIWMEIVILLSLLSIFLYRFRAQARPAFEFPHAPVSPPKLYLAVSIVFYSLLAFALVAFTLLSLSEPHGGWDAWGIWNMRARFIFRGGDHWRDAFSTVTHPDYPLLVPGIVARCWRYLGHDTVVIPILIGLFFTFITIGLTFSSLCLLRSKVHGFLAGIALLGTPFFLKLGAYQYADVPLGFFFLATLVLLCFHDRSSAQNYNLLPLVGMATGLAAWTKNEGLLFLVCVVLVRCIIVVPTKGWRSYFGQMFWFMIGLSIILIAIVTFKIKLAPLNDLVSLSAFQSALGRLVEVTRYFQILKSYAITSVAFGGGIVNPYLLAVSLILLGIEIEPKYKSAINTSLLVLGLMATGYFFIYVVTPHNLAWHLRTSLNRLFLQLWPSLVFTSFMVMSLPAPLRLEADTGGL